MFEPDLSELAVNHWHSQPEADFNSQHLGIDRDCSSSFCIFRIHSIVIAHTHTKGHLPAVVESNLHIVLHDTSSFPSNHSSLTSIRLLRTGFPLPVYFLLYNLK